MSDLVHDILTFNDVFSYMLHCCLAVRASLPPRGGGGGNGGGRCGGRRRSSSSLNNITYQICQLQRQGKYMHIIYVINIIIVT